MGNEAREYLDKVAVLDAICEAVEDLMPVAAPRVKGLWISDGHHLRCNQCKYSSCMTDREGGRIADNFCPNCGADMGGYMLSDAFSESGEEG